MQITDSLMLDASGLTLTRDGYLVGEAKVSRAFNVQQYYGSEIGLTGDQASKIFGVYRDPDVVFNEDSMMTLAGRPVTRGHPPRGVSADNWKALTVGQMGGVIRRDGEHVVAPMAIMDAAAVKEVGAGARSLSAGYSVEIIADEGTAPDGTPFQYRQSGALKFNHVAYLPDNNPRAGNTRIGDNLRIGDWHAADAPELVLDPNKGARSMTTLTLDGISVEVADATTAANLKSIFDKQAKTIADAAAAQAVADAAHAKALADAQGELAKKDAEIDGLKGKVVDGAALDAMVAARSELVTVAAAIAPDIKTAGLSDAAIRKAVVVAKRGAAVAEKPEAYMDAAFDILADEHKAQTGAQSDVRLAIGNLQPTVSDAKKVDDAYQTSVSDLNAWRNQKGA